MEQFLPCKCLDNQVVQCQSQFCLFTKFYGTPETSRRYNQEMGERICCACLDEHTEEKPIEVSICRHLVCRSCIKDDAVFNNKDYLQCPMCREIYRITQEDWNFFTELMTVILNIENQLN